MDLSWRISRIISDFLLLSTYKSYSGTKTDTEEKYKTKIEKQKQQRRYAEKSRLR